MPEGDTIHRAAQTLHRALAGQRVVRFESVLPALTRLHEDAPLTGQTVEAVVARGKHLLMQFSGGQTLRTHMRMNGSWHIYRPGESWQRPRRDMRVVVATRTFEAVGFNIPVAEFVDGRKLAKHQELSRLGPDLLGDEFDRDDSASVAVLWGDNGTFCAGADLKAFGTPEMNPAHRTGPGPMGPSRMVLTTFSPAS